MGASEWIVASNAAFLLPAFAAWKQRYVLRCVVFFLLAAFSGLYHACESQITCVYDYEMLRKLDWTLSFAAIALVVLLFATYDEPECATDLTAQVAACAGAAAIAFLFPSHMTLTASLFAIPLGGWIVLTWVWSGHVAVMHPVYAACALITMLVALMLFYIARDGEQYQAMHGSWHALSAVSATLFIMYVDSSAPNPYTQLAPLKNPYHMVNTRRLLNLHSGQYVY
jgi:hypothetical protein